MIGNVFKSCISSTGEYRGIKYMIREIESELDITYLFGPSKWFAAYIELPSGVDEDSLECHGGCTFCSDQWPEVFEKVAENHRIFGWDYNHLLDWSKPATGSKVLQDIKDTIDWFKVFMEHQVKSEKSTKVNKSQIDFLKPCPFCGSTDVQCTQDKYGYWGIECLARDCHAYLTNAKWVNENKEMAIELWNRRVNE